MKQGARRPSATIMFYWNERAKRWDVVARVGGPGASLSASSRVETTCELDRTGLALVLRAVRAEMEGWLDLPSEDYGR